MNYWNVFKTLLIFILCLLGAKPYAADTCSRVAIINNQEVLIDSNSNERGEGLRFHLEKDPIAKDYLEKYQEGTKLRIENTIMGSLGTAMLISSVMVGNESNSRQTLLIGGATMMILNFLIARTTSNANERNLRRAIEEYNKRNYPKIFFDPDQSTQNNVSPELGLSFSKTWTF